MGEIAAYANMPINSYTGHQFIFIPKGSDSFSSSKELVYTVNLSQKSARFAVNEEGKVIKTELKEMTLKERESKQNHDLIASFSKTVPVKFRNLSNRTIALWYDDGDGGQRQGVIAEGSDTSTNSYDGHTFCFSEVRRDRT